MGELERRTVLAAVGGVVAVAAIGTVAVRTNGPTAPERDSVEAPETAADAGFSRLLFSDDFDSPASLDLTASGEGGFKWYTAGARAFGQLATPPADLRVDGSVLTIDPSATNFNWNIATADPNTGAGQTFGHGYFEARMRFPVQPAPAPMTSDGRFAWPAFWGLSQAYVLGKRGRGGWGELDFFEAAAGASEFVGTIHDWGSAWNGSEVRNGVPIQPVAADFTQWHTFGCLWKPGHASWYLDGTRIHQQEWGDGGPKPEAHDVKTGRPVPKAFQIMDREPARGGLNVILGSGAGRPMDVDWVRVWGA